MEDKTKQLAIYRFKQAIEKLHYMREMRVVCDYGEYVEVSSKMARTQLRSSKCIIDLLEEYLYKKLFGAKDIAIGGVQKKA